MMKSKLSIALCILSGSFFLYCGESAVNKMLSGNDKGDASFVNDAKAQNSCNSACGAPTFTKLWEGDLTAASALTPAFNVTSFREYVVYSQKTGGGNFCALNSVFRLDATSPHGTANTFGMQNGNSVIRLPTYGNDMSLNAGDCDGEWKFHVLIAGIP